MSYCHSMADTVANHTMAKTMAKELGGSRSGGGKGSDAQEALMGEKFYCKIKYHTAVIKPFPGWN